MSLQVPQIDRAPLGGLPLTNGSSVIRGESAAGSVANPVIENRPLWKRALYYVAAGAFFVIGVLGAILPGLPATPFLLLTSFFLVRCSPRLNSALLRSRIFGPILIDWQVHGGVRRSVRIKAIIAVIAMVALTIWLSGYALPPTMAVLGLSAVGVVVILKLPTAR